MSVIRYTIEQFHNFKETDYYFQLTNGRKLSSVFHSHAFYEIVVMISGSVVQVLDGKDQLLQAGECVILSPANSHTFHSQEENTNIFCVSVSQKKYEEMERALGIRPACGQPFKIDADAYLHHANRLFFISQEEQIIRLNYLLSDLFKTNTPLKKASTLEDYPSFLREALQKIRTPEHLERGVPALLALTGYSRAQLCRLTKAVCGKTPFELITQIRMEIIKEYLEKSDLSLEKIAEVTGYNSLSQFHSAVKNFYGKTPGQLRKENLYH